MENATQPQTGGLFTREKRASEWWRYCAHSPAAASLAVQNSLFQQKLAAQRGAPLAHELELAAAAMVASLPVRVVCLISLQTLQGFIKLRLRCAALRLKYRAGAFSLRAGVLFCGVLGLQQRHMLQQRLRAASFAHQRLDLLNQEFKHRFPLVAAYACRRLAQCLAA